MKTIENGGRRYLDGKELSHFKHNVSSDFFVEYSGYVCPEKMRQAIQILCSRYPVLGSIVQTDERGYWIDVSEGKSPDIETIEGGRVEAFCLCYELHSNLLPRLSFFILARKESSGCFIFGLSHVIADAHAIYAYVSELWKLYTDIYNGSPVEYCEPKPLPKSWDKVRERFQDSSVRQKEPKIPLLQAFQIANQVSTTHIRSGTVKLSEQETKEFINSARVNGVTVGALLVGTLAEIMREWGLISSTRPLNISVNVDMRNDPRSSVKGSEATGLTQYRNISIEPIMNSNSILIAREFKEELNRHIENLGMSAYRSISSEDEFKARSCALQKATIFLNNAGPAPMLSTPVNARITDAGLPKFEADYPKRPNFGLKSSSVAASVPCSIQCATFQGRMWLMLSLPDGPGNSV